MPAPGPTGGLATLVAVESIEDAEGRLVEPHCKPGDVSGSCSNKAAASFRKATTSSSFPAFALSCMNNASFVTFISSVKAPNGLSRLLRARV